MSYENLEVGDQKARESVERAVRAIFTGMDTSDKSLVLKDVIVGERLDPQDFSTQKEKRMRKGTWGPSVYGVFSLLKGGKEIDKGRVKLMTLPQKTGRFTYIYGGDEYQFDTQFRLKPGIYTRITDKGEYASRISAEGKFYRSTEIFFDPESKLFNLRVGSSNVPLTTLLEIMGATHQDIERAVGAEVARANSSKPIRQLDKDKLYKALFGEKSKGEGDLVAVKKAFDESRLDPDATEYTTGERISKVDKQAILTTMKRLLSLARNESEEDDMNSLVTKSVLYYEDYLEEFIQKQGNDLKRKIMYKLPQASKVSQVVGNSALSPAVSKMISSSLGQRKEQYNVLDILSGVGRTTLRGPGGISDPNMISDEMRTVHPSHMAFLDPVKTSESGATIGTTLYLAAGAGKEGNKIVTRFTDVKTGKIVKIPPEKAYNSVVAFPDQYDLYKQGKPKPKTKTIKAAYKGNVNTYSPDKVDYIPTSSLGMFHYSTNLIPFLMNNHGTRAMTAVRMQEQAIPLINREEPNVQVRVGSGHELTMESVLGEQVGAALSPVAGTVSSIRKGKITIKDDKGEPHVVNIYDNFPLNNSKSYLHSDPLVSVGDKVKKNQVIADSNNTKNGKLSLGVNLRTAYTPWKGLNFEDAVVISESAAKKMSSDHLHQFDVDIDKEFVVGKKQFQTYYPNDIDVLKSEKLDEEGVIKEGQVVERGDFIFAGLRKRDIDPDSEAVLRVSKKAVSSYSDESIKWEKNYPGIVTEVVKMPKKFIVHVKTREPSIEGDKIVSRHGNKGIISSVVPDDEMPVGEDGKPFEMIMNPLGIVGRTNIGQVYETLAGKVSEKIGKPIKVDNFSTDQDMYEWVKDLAKKHGVKDSEIITDPKDGPTDKPVFTGSQYMFKLTHQIDKKTSVRGAVSKSTGERLPYTSDYSPARGGSESGQSIGRLDIYGLLAHGATGNLNEMFTYKSDQQNAMFWNQLKSGGILPPPEVPFTAKKFLAYLEGMGVHVNKDGSKLRISPLTDKDVKTLSSGELRSPGDALDYKLRPVKGGIFDSLTTGGLRGGKWSHIDLPTPVMNPIARDGVARILAYAHPEEGAKLLDKLLDGTHGLSKSGDVVPVNDAAIVGVEAVKSLLSKVDVTKMLAAVTKELNSAPPSKVAILHKTRKYLVALKELGYSPDEAYILSKFPVIPPEYRPLIIGRDGKIEMDDVNGLYKKLGEMVTTIKGSPSSLPPGLRAQRSKGLQDLVDAVSVSGYNDYQRPMKSIMQLVKGPAPKYGFFQRRVLKRRQDLSARTTVVPNPELDIDTLEVPEKILWELYSPFVTRKMRQSGYSSKDSLEHVKNKTEVAKSILVEEMKDRPVLMKRDPVLHKFGVQSFEPKISPSDTIRVPPSVTSGYNMDFDGDQVSLFVPATEEAKEEAKGLAPSRNLYSPTTDRLMHKPEKESQYGLFMLTELGKDTRLTFSKIEEAMNAYKQRRIKLQDQFMYKGRKTTLGRLMIASMVPPGRINDQWYQRIAYDKQFKMDKGETDTLLDTIAKVQPGDFPKTLMSLRQLGNKAAYKLGGSFALTDFKPMHHLNKQLSNDVSTSRKISIYDSHRAKIESQAQAQLKNNPMYKMVQSGARGSWDQMKQLVLSPGLATNSKGGVVSSPVNKSYAEGLDLPSYWSTLHGARHGMISKTKQTAMPGYLTRQMVSSVADVRVSEPDCHTTQGILESVDSKDIIGRYTPVDQKVGNKTLSKGSLIDSQVLMLAKAADVKKLMVRSPLKCETSDGICAKCFGKWHDGNLPPVGTNIGVISAQAMGEPTTQMSMKLFHEGGVKGKTSKLVDAFSQAKSLLEVPLKMANEAVLAENSGKVSRINKEAAGWRVTISGDTQFVPASLMLKIKVGDKVKKGQAISTGSVNPHRLVELAGPAATQLQLTNDLDQAYGGLGVKKRHLETVVRHMTGLGLVSDAHPDSGFVRGDIVPMAKVTAFNNREVPVDWAIGKTLDEKKHTYGKGTLITDEVAKDLKLHGVVRVKVKESGGIVAKPIVRGVNTLPLLRTDDWMAQMSFERLQKTLTTGALSGQKADIQGNWPLQSVGFGQLKKS